MVPSQSLAYSKQAGWGDTYLPSLWDSQRQKMLKSFVNTQGLDKSMWVASIVFISPKYFYYFKNNFNHPKMSRNFTSSVTSWKFHFQLQAQTGTGAPFWFVLIPEPSGNRPSFACSCLQRGGPERGSTCPWPLSAEAGPPHPVPTRSPLSPPTPAQHSGVEHKTG